ncbi:MAG: hypothetical protein JWM78_266 [Verrucomicrobiaceae bacterium]|nr:hypothetical protein [Verrucomicrobiaceae bacterium]
MLNIRPIVLSSSLRTRLSTVVFCIVLTACQTTPKTQAPAAPLRPVATHAFTLAQDGDDVVGRLQVTRAHDEDTLSDIARRFNIGYEEIVRANPGVDPWLPREGTPIVLPTQFVLPAAPHSGIVINLAALRIYYFPPRKGDEPQTVITHPIGIGMIGWSTPIGTTKIVSKRADPWWYPPASVRKEHAEDGDILPAKVKPGPDNPLGRFAMNLDWPSYLIHGTNQPYGVGVRASHGCIRLYPEDIAQLFGDIPIGTPVTVVNQSQVYGTYNGVRYLQSYPVFEDYADKKSMAAKNSTAKKDVAKKDAIKKETAKKDALAIAKANKSDATKGAASDENLTILPPQIDNPVVTDLIKNPRGIAVPVSTPQINLEKLIADAPRVENRLPENATWDGVE